MESGTPQPGQTVSPTGVGQPAPTAPPQPDPPQDEVAQEEPAPAPPQQAQTPLAESTASDPQELPDDGEQSGRPQQLTDADVPPSQPGGWSYEGLDEQDAEEPDPQEIVWTASEFIAHAKPFGWYAALAAGALVFAGLVYLVTKDFISVGVILVAGLLLGIYAGHQPRQLEYRIGSRGLKIGPKSYSYDDFQSFSVLPEGAFSSIVFMPLRRFAIPTTIYYPPEEEDRIVEVLADHLPMEQRGHDAVDRLMHRMRF